MYIARAFSHQEEFFAAVERAARDLPPGVVRVTPTLGTDWDGEPSVFFEVIFADGIPNDEFQKLRRQVSFSIRQQLETLEEWDVLAYFEFRTKSEQAIVEELTKASTDGLTRMN